jgi:hypothetical protein
VVGSRSPRGARYPGAPTGATDLASVEAAARFCIETAKSFGAGTCRFCANAEFERLTGMYGPMDRLQTSGNPIDG